MRRLMFAQTPVCFYRKEHANEKKRLECGQSRYIEVVTQNEEKVTA
jgi:hypothetical protein